MKAKIIKYRGAEIRIDREFFSFLLGIILIILCAIMSGILQFLNIGFDFSLIKTSNFWTGYLLKLAIGYLCLFGCYLLKKNINKKSAKFITQRQDIIGYRKAINKNNELSIFKDWLKNVYNYRKKVELYQDYLLRINEKIDIEEPVKVDEKYKSSEKKIINFFFKFINFFLRIKFWIYRKIYNWKLKTYNKNLKTRKYIEGQLNVCNLHFQIIDAYKAGDKGKVESLDKKLDGLENNLNSFKARFKRVTFSRIFNFDILNSKVDDSIDTNEGKFLLKNVLPFLFLGAAGICLIASIVLDLRQFGIESLILIFLNLFVIGWNAFSGIMLSNRFCWGSLYNADSNRINILSEFKEDSNLVIEENVKEEKEGE